MNHVKISGTLLTEPQRGEFRGQPVIVATLKTDEQFRITLIARGSREQQLTCWGKGDSIRVLGSLSVGTNCIGVTVDETCWYNPPMFRASESVKSGQR